MASSDGDGIRSAVIEFFRALGEAAIVAVRAVHADLLDILGSAGTTRYLNRVIAIGAAVVAAALMLAPPGMRHDEIAGALMVWAVTLWTQGDQPEIESY